MLQATVHTHVCTACMCPLALPRPPVLWQAPGIVSQSMLQVHDAPAQQLMRFVNLQEQLPETFSLDPKVFRFVLNVVAVEGMLWWNLHEVDSTYRQTVFLTQSPKQLVSTAVHKLQEALEVTGHRLDADQKAIDLGDVC